MLREINGLGGTLEPKNGKALSPADMRAKAAYIGDVAKKLAAASKSSPPKCDPAPVIKALNQLAEGHPTTPIQPSPGEAAAARDGAGLRPG